MTQLFDEKWPWIEGMNGFRLLLLETLSDADLAFSPGGDNPSLGALFRASGEVEQSYIDSFKTFRQDFTYRNPDPALETSVEHLKSWYQSLDTAFKTALAAIPDADAQKPITRPTGNTCLPSLQVDIYVQAVMIFFGKAVVYFRAMRKPLPQAIEDYVA